MDRAKFFAAVRSSVFGGSLSQAQVNGIEAIIDGWQRNAMTDLRWLAYALATAFHETAKTMQPVRETLATSDAQAIDRLERAYQSGRLPQVSTPYWRRDATGQSWFGRGFVQLTHKRNYQAMTKALGVDLVADPAKAMQLDIAADILLVGMRDGLFSGRKLDDYFTATTTNWQSARRMINGTDKAALIAGYAKAFHAALLGA